MKKEFIPAVELRIGNLHKGECFDIAHMGQWGSRISGQCYGAITGLGISNVETGTLKLEPIPIDENWLAALGFSLYKNDSESPSDWYWTINDMPSIWNESWIFQVGGYRVKVKYVHQLQNLYFAFASKELTTKLIKEDNI